jgi:BirA family biotin operon repressor/biotin-[acetyl-CoA-carboxylase] ligase
VAAAAVAMADAVAETTGLDVALKWPNDLLVGDRKLGGVLAEAAGDAVVVGIGVNVDWPEVPADLEGIATACNLAGGRPTTREDLLAVFLGRYERRLADLEGTRRAYRDRLGTRGRRVRIERPNDTILGVALDIDDAGHLIVDVDGRHETITAGDVIHLRDAER